MLSLKINSFINIASLSGQIKLFFKKYCILSEEYRIEKKSEEQGTMRSYRGHDLHAGCFFPGPAYKRDIID